MPSEKIVRVRLEQLCTNAARIQFGDCNNNFLTCYTNRSFSIDHCPFGEDVKFCSRGEGVYTFKESKYSRQAVVCHFISVDGTHCLLAAGNNVPSNVHYGNAIPFTTFLLQEFCARNSTKKYRLAPAVQMNVPCRSWYVDCQKSVQQIVNCERGALYDNTRQRCISDALSESTCSASTVQPSCNGRHWQTFSLERCSRRFFYCEGGIAREYVCAEGYKYYQGQCITETIVPECSSCVNAQPYRLFNVPCNEECTLGTSYRISCSEYMQCQANGQFVHGTCPPLYAWDIDNARCVPDVNCVTYMRIAYFNLNACERYFECFDGSWRLFTCPSGEVFDMSTTRCVSFNGDCSQWLSGASVQPRHNSFNKLNWYPDAPNVNEKMSSGCVLGSTYRDDYDCSRYYACSSAGYLSYRCAHGTTFNAQKGICDGTNACDLSRCIDGSTRSLRKCGFYKICVQGMWIERVCDNGMQFINGQCQGYCSSSGEAIADDRDCTLYLVCYKGYLEQRQCQYGTTFDPNVGYCRNGYSCPSGRSPNCYDSQKKAIDGETSKYLSCVEGTYYQRMCPAGQIFRSDINACDVGPVVDSTNHQSNIVNEACEESGGALGYRADPSNCKKFYQCAQGRWVSKDCPPGLVWNSNAVVCDWPRNVPECNFM
ncbi:unnamed protein product [Anisakis simplex]|uniref:Chitin-binding type-2 domain-containing protein n=1 Tax=Anisakis simplex TaxID=6269 RepID=A0A0M3JUH8_ANISI|nr:unnamed protein product [Anisakis simplex]